MIIVELNGGMGNQLFQYASAKSLALHCNTTLKLDINFFTAQGKSFDLIYFNIDDAIADAGEIAAFQQRSFARKFTDRLKPNHLRKVYREPYYHFDKNFFKASCQVHLKGLRQSEKYFLRFAAAIKNRLQVKEQYCAALKHLKDKISRANSVSIHIRRGDYLTKVALEVLGLQPIEYYEAAIQTIAGRVKDPVFYIFSDDIEWARENLRINYPHEFASGTLSKTPIEDFYLMTHCKHAILANSTFSWWTAWLNDYDEKIIIAPQKWFNQAKFDTSDLVPSGWLRL